jgi:hypothetical protein
MDLRMIELAGAWFGFEVAGLGGYNPFRTNGVALRTAEQRRRAGGRG